ENNFYLRKKAGVRGSYELVEENEILENDDLSKLSEDEKLDGIEPSDYNGRYYIPYDKGGESNI
ncbi:MAG: hypothetical protein GTO02_18210, partial [Candidatus Dadabacteria bacterium]|nr:hypothetical protein [Candidatus Dadabacteria bacterium]